MKKIILLDVDHTLFDTDKFRARQDNNLISILETNKQTYNKVRDRYLNSLLYDNDYNMDAFVKYVAKSFSADLKKLKRGFFDDPLFYKSVFADVKTTLVKLRRDYTLGIFSEGFVRFQKLKLEKAKLARYFSKKHIYIFRRKLKKSSLAKLPKKAIIIDDSLKAVEELHKSNQFNLVWLNRRSKKKSSKIKTIHNLNKSINHL